MKALHNPCCTEGASRETLANKLFFLLNEMEREEEADRTFHAILIAAMRPDYDVRVLAHFEDKGAIDVQWGQESDYQYVCEINSLPEFGRFQDALRLPVYTAKQVQQRSAAMMYAARALSSAIVKDFERQGARLQALRC